MARRSILLAFAIGAIGAIVGGATMVWAGHQFTDVPDTHAFHDEIGAVTDAGCAAGFDNGTFRPGLAPTRGQFAYWMNNCGGRVATIQGSAEVTAADDPQLVTVASRTIEAGALPSGSGFVLVIADLNTSVNPSCSSCRIRWDLRAASSAAPGTENLVASTTTSYGEITSVGGSFAAVSETDAGLNTVIPVDGGTTLTVRVAGDWLTASGGTQEGGATARMSLLYVPFDGFGNGGG